MSHTVLSLTETYSPHSSPHVPQWPHPAKPQATPTAGSDKTQSLRRTPAPRSSCTLHSHALLCHPDTTYCSTSPAPSTATTGCRKGILESGHSIGFSAHSSLESTWVVCVNDLFLFTAEQYSQCDHSPAEGCLGRFQFGAVSNKATPAIWSRFCETVSTFPG
jgi:hypothetical protein